jgi:hypothetical protein
MNWRRQVFLRDFGMNPEKTTRPAMNREKAASQNDNRAFERKFSRLEATASCFGAA